MKLNFKDKKILFFDIETSFLKVYTFYIGRKVFISHDQIIEPQKVISIAYKYAGKKEIHILTWDKHQNDKQMLKEFGKILRDCDVAIAHNGDRFDLGVLQARTIQMRLEPLTNIVSIDTLKLSRANFRFNSHKLDSIGEILGVGRKAKTPGMQMWIDVMHGNVKALNQMVAYNKQDVKLLEKIFFAMLPYVKKLPISMSVLLNDHREGCQNCGSMFVQKRGFSVSRSGRKQRYGCQNCGTFYAGTKLI